MVARRRHRILAVLGPVLIVASAAGCVNDHDVRVAPAAAVAWADPAPAAPPEPAGPHDDTRLGERDPFRSMFDEELTDPSAGDTPLTQRELDAFRLVGIVSSTATPMALVEDPTGAGHRVKVGDRIGRQGGQVTSIQADRVIVTERLYDPILGARAFQRVLALPGLKL